MKFWWTAWLTQLKRRGHLSVQELASGYSLGDRCQIHTAIDPLPLSLYVDQKFPLTLHVNRHQESVGTSLWLQSAPHNPHTGPKNIDFSWLYNHIWKYPYTCQHQLAISKVPQCKKQFHVDVTRSQLRHSQLRAHCGGRNTRQQEEWNGKDPQKKR